jgi:hypothetical protein
MGHVIDVQELAERPSAPGPLGAGPALGTSPVCALVGAASFLRRLSRRSGPQRGPLLDRQGSSSMARDRLPRVPPHSEELNTRLDTPLRTTGGR